jgi:hypothetical protein
MAAGGAQYSNSRLPSSEMQVWAVTYDASAFTDQVGMARYSSHHILMQSRSRFFKTGSSCLTLTLRLVSKSFIDVKMLAVSHIPML